MQKTLPLACRRALFTIRRSLFLVPRTLKLVPCAICLAACSFLLSPAAFSQAPASWTSADMYLALRKLNVVGSVLYVAAHPDDENTRLITYFSKDRLLRTGYLSLTRGDGGQNLIGDEQGIELGLIRTQELLAARRIDGGEQFFTRAYDFGYSKTPEETFTKWDREKILRDVVWVIRKFRPDVIITRFPTTGEGGHGHHTASAILANEAFTAAADPNRFPEQLRAGHSAIASEHYTPWQAKRILWNAFNFGGSPAPSPDMFRIDVGGYNPLLGKSYGEIAAESRSQHKSQGFGVPASRGESFESFKTTGGPAPVNDILEGVDLSWKRVPGGEHIAKIVDSLVVGFDFLQPERSVKGLVLLYKAIQALPANPWKKEKLEDVRELIMQCSGLFIDVTANKRQAAETDSVRITTTINNRLGAPATLKNVAIWTSDTTLSRELARNKNVVIQKSYYISPAIPLTQPYWLKVKMSEGYFNIAAEDSLRIGQPDVQPSLEALVQLHIDGQDIIFNKPVMYKFTDPVKGELYEPFVVMPRLLVSPDQPLHVSVGSNNFSGTVRVTANANDRQAVFNTLSNGSQTDGKYKFSPAELSFTPVSRSVEARYNIEAGKDAEHLLRVSAESTGGPYAAGMREIKYDHIPYITYFPPAVVKNVKLDLKTYNKKIGYIIGAGDKVPEALEQMGYDVTLLTNKELSRNNLNQFDAIMTGVRAYNTNEWMNDHYDKLMKYVNDGGNLIVQYNTSNQIGPVRAKMGPYNFNISRTRVTDENAAVTFINPKHPVLNFPNTITADDFKGWVQERSIYHAAAWDSTKFETVIAMSDPGEKPEPGSLIIAKHGKGYFTYTGLVFFRELPAGVPGAYRLLANIIALNRKRAF